MILKCFTLKVVSPPFDGNLCQSNFEKKMVIMMFGNLDVLPIEIMDEQFITKNRAYVERIAFLALAVVCFEYEFDNVLYQRLRLVFPKKKGFFCFSTDFPTHYCCFCNSYLGKRKN